MSARDAPWRYVDVDGIRTRYRESGRGEAVVFVHGGDFGRSGGDTWPDEVFDLLDDRYRVIVVDRLGQGRTDNPRRDEGYRMSAVIGHFAAFLRGLGVTGATLVGQSRGGYVVTRTAHRHPDLVRRLVIVNSGSIAVGYPSEAVPGMKAYEVYRRMETLDPRAAAASLCVRTDHLTDEWVAERTAIQALPKTAAAQAAQRRLAPALFREFEADKAETVKWMIGGGLTKPVLIVWGVGDPTLEPIDGLNLFQALAPHNDRLSALFINRAGHMVYREHAVRVTTGIRHFIEQN